MAVAAQAIRLSDLAEAIGASCRGDGELMVHGVASLAQAGPNDLSFLTNPKYVGAARATAAGALLVTEGADPGGLRTALVIVDDAQQALAAVLALMFPVPQPVAGVHPTAILGDGCVLGENVAIGPYCVIGARSRLDDRVQLGSHVTLGEGCSVGAETIVCPRVVFYDRVTVGKRSVVHAGAVIGSDGFGYASNTGLPTKLQQVGTVVLGDEVEVGANTTIDRGALEETRIGSGTKIDNLVQVGHNVILGEGCLLCGQAGIAGSAVLGDHVVLAGQAGVSGHLELGDGVQVAAKSAVLQTTAAGSVVGGIPAMPIRQWQRQAAALRRLGKLRRRVSELERALQSLEG